ncbi:hemolysin family protein [Kocuria rhizophila]|uniref:hemolysin family protein n=1 Tax=Kocuria TaxID=57493 RepID=UPI00201A0F92|nr:hemolysin family protein [Kocuria rhizophila]MDA4829255.1 hemolysin family protein [Kocuria rhizophila]
MLTAWLLLLAFLFLVLANALFVAVEFAFLTVDRQAVQRAEKAGDKRAVVIEESLKKTSTNLSGAQLGITVTSLMAGYLTGPSLGTLFTEGLGWAGVPDAVAVGIATVAAFVVATFSQMVFSELVPKNWAIADPMRVTHAVVLPQKLFMTVFGWLVSMLNSSANAVLKVLGFTPTEEVANARTAEELASVVSRSGREGTLDAGTAELVARSIEFGDRTAADVMRPRPRVTFLDAEDTVEHMLLTASETGHSRFPVTGETVDDIVGVVHYTHALAVPFDERAVVRVSDVCVPADVVSESMTLDPLMRQLRVKGLQLAVVVDEYGGTAGIVTLEDLIEEIVGEIDDEQDTRVQRFRRTRDGGLVVSGLLRPDELGDVLRVDMPEGEESDTLGGLMAEELDRLPQVGDTLTVEAVDHFHRDDDDLPTKAEIRLDVMRMDQHRVDRILVHRVGGNPDERGGSTTSTAWQPPGRPDPLGGDNREPETAEEFRLSQGENRGAPGFHRDEDVSDVDPGEEQR